VESDDRSLLSRARAGDDVALDELVRRHDPVLATIARYLGADDGADAAVLRAWTSVLETTPTGAVRSERSANGEEAIARAALVTSLLRELRIDAATAGELPRHPPDGVFLDADDDDPTLEHRWKGSYAEDVRDWGRFGADLTGSAATREVLATAVSDLPSLPRVVILLRDVAGLNLDRVATLVGLLPTDTGAYLHWARIQVHDALAQRLHGEAGT
jgi:DNA-directed RNA polymerase specialized sigma24 family protein